MDDIYSVEDFKYIEDFIEKGVDPSYFKVQSQYEKVLFEDGTPFVGDVLQPFMPIDIPTESTILMAAEADFNRATLLTINGSQYPSITNLNFEDYEKDIFPTTTFQVEELYEDKITYDSSTGGLRFPPEIQSKEILEFWDEIGDLLFRLDYEGETSKQGVKVFEYSLHAAPGTQNH